MILQSKWMTRIQRGLGILIAIAALAWVILRIDLSQTLTAIAASDFRVLLLGFAGFYLTVPLRAVRWRILLLQVEGAVPLGFLMRTIFQAWFVNCSLPGRAGDLYAAYLMRSRCGLSMTRSAATIFTARVLDLSVLFALVAFVFFAYFRHLIPSGVRTLVYSGLVMGVALAAFLLVMVFARGLAIRVLPPRLGYYYDRFVGAFVGSLRRIPTLLALTLALWLLEAVRLSCVLVALGASPPWGWVVFLALAAAVLTTLPITPGGLGTVELFYLEMFPIAGIPTELVGGIILMDRVINYWFILIAGALLFLTDRTTRVELARSPIHVE